MADAPLPAASIFLLCSALLCAWLSIHALAQRRTAFSLCYAALMACSALYALGYGLELATSNASQMYTMLRIQYLGIPFIPPAWIGLAWAYQDARGLPPRLMALLLGFSLLMALLFQSNELHRLYYTELHYTRVQDLAIAQTGKGPAYWLYIAYQNLCAGAGVLLLFRAWRQSAPLYHRQATCLLLGSLCPWLFHLLYQLDWTPNSLDLSPFGLVCAGLMFALASFRHGVLNVLPMARDTVFESLSEGVLVVDAEQRLIDFNPAAQQLFPALTASRVGQPLANLDGTAALAAQLAQPRFELLAGNPPRALEVCSRPLSNRRGRTLGSTILIRDVTEKKQLIDQLQRLASFDELTGVFNRRHLMQQSERQLELAKRHAHPLAVIIADVDNFKTINDSAGHLAGDQLLQRIAATLRQRLRSTDILGRYGGDEFILTLPETTALQAAELARQLNQACGEECGSSLSLGVAELQAESTDFKALLRLADLALYQAKRLGRNQAQIYVPTNDNCQKPMST